MKIQQADVRLAAGHTQREEESHRESLHFWVGDRPPDSSDTAARLNTTDSLAISTEAATILADHSPKPEVSSYTETEQETVPVDPKIRAIQRVLEMLTGKKINISSMGPLESNTPVAPHSIDGQQEGLERVGWGLEYDATDTYTEIEETRIAADGTVHTSDGVEINFALRLEMYQAHTEESSIQIRAGDARLIDPLVINFNGTAAELDNMAFSFDLDGDGTAENIPFVGSGSGFLVLDKNQDGIVNNGFELFGPASGNGFNELAAFDQDSNGWLDEADPIFDKLRVWTRDALGGTHLQSLSEQGVGALLLSRVDSPFSLKNNAGELQGVIKETSIFLKEDGSVGTIQEIDLAV